jgi:hypothetical protein
MKSTLSLEHIDPLKHDLVCGLRNDHNEVIADITYNKSKTNRFVPYRVCTYNAPVSFGDIAEFLIKGKWVVCEFGGDIWKKECRRIGFNSTKTGRKVGTQHKLNKTAIFDPVNTEKVQKGRSRGSAKGAEARKKPVRITTPCGEVFEFNSCTEAGRRFNLNLGELSKCCRGVISNVKGFGAEFT